MNIPELIQSEYQDDMSHMQAWCDMIYQQQFASYFSTMRDLYDKLKFSTISDSELEWAITSFPLELFKVSEALNSVRLNHEMVKLKNKEKRSKVADKSDMLENDILLAAYSSIITRVENEISFSREFIMGAKKVWDARRRAEASNPIGEVVPQTQIDLPNYMPDNKTYIK